MPSIRQRLGYFFLDQSGGQKPWAEKATRLGLAAAFISALTYGGCLYTDDLCPSDMERSANIASWFFLYSALGLQLGRTLASPPSNSSPR